MQPSRTAPFSWRCADARGGAGEGGVGTSSPSLDRPRPHHLRARGPRPPCGGKGRRPRALPAPIMPPSAASSGGGERGGVAGRGRGLQGGEDPKTAEEGVAGREVLLISLWSFLLRRESFRMPQGRVARTRRRLPACVRLKLNFPGKAPSVRGRRGKVLAAAPPLLPVLYFWRGGGGGRFAT